VNGLLEVSNIDVLYGGAHALWDVSLKADKGEVVAIIGSNGAGKTTLLNTISGLLRPAAGEITYLGKHIHNLSPHQIIEMGIVHVPEGRALFPYMTVLENLELGAYMKATRGKKSERLEQIFAMFPTLKERQKQLSGTLSGGEQQMLAMARGLMSNPNLFLLDEPSLGLAPKMVLRVFEIIKEIQKMGVGVLLVEQNVYHALEFAERAYVLETGRVTLEGTGEELLNSDYVKKAYLGI
jgi:branched-chain amino acid transport system ATP-binding protein